MPTFARIAVSAAKTADNSAKINHIQSLPALFIPCLQIGEASKVVPVDKLSVVITLVLAFVFLHESFTAK